MLIWLIAASFVLILELFLGTVYLLVVSAALAGAALANWLFDSLPISIGTAALLSAIGLLWVHNWLGRHKLSSEQQAIANDLDIGNTVKILTHIHNNDYRVFYRGIEWQAETTENTTPLAPGSYATIIDRRSNILIIQPTQQEK